MFQANTLTISRPPQDNELERHVKTLIVRDLFHLNWDLRQNGHTLTVTPPSEYSKDIIRESMAFKRIASIRKSQAWIDKHVHVLRENLASGAQALSSPIKARIDVCVTQKQHDLFRLCRYYWSSPYSDYVGRRIKLLIRDTALPHCPLIGIAALGSPIIHIPERDNWVGWDKKIRTRHLNLCMDAYVLGALPPYNTLLGGKLIAYLLASNEVRKIYKNKYKNYISEINGTKSSELVCLFTTSLYGKSSQYNRVNIDSKPLYIEIGKTKGFGSLHLSDETFLSMQELLKQKDIRITNKFGDGPNWRMRLIRTACDCIGIDADILLCHSFKRNIYAVPLANNFREILSGSQRKPSYYNYPQKFLEDYWNNRWLTKRKLFLKESGRVNEVLSFEPQLFNVYD